MNPARRDTGHDTTNNLQRLGRLAISQSKSQTDQHIMRYGTYHVVVLLVLAHFACSVAFITLLVAS